MKLPNFLKDDYVPSKENIELAHAFERYIEKYGSGNLNTEDKILTTREWINAYNGCVEKGIELDEYLPFAETEDTMTEEQRERFLATTDYDEYCKHQDEFYFPIRTSQNEEEAELLDHLIWLIEQKFPDGAQGLKMIRSGVYEDDPVFAHYMNKRKEEFKEQNDEVSE